jgi:hypothetical protein
MNTLLHPLLLSLCLFACTKAETPTVDNNEDSGWDSSLDCPETIPEAAGEDAVCCVPFSGNSGFSFARADDYVCDGGDEVTIFKCNSDGSYDEVDTCAEGTYCSIDYVDEDDDGYNESVYECTDSPPEW